MLFPSINHIALNSSKENWYSSEQGYSVKESYLGNGTWMFNLTRNLNDWEVDDYLKLLNSLFQVVIFEGIKDEPT